MLNESDPLIGQKIDFYYPRKINAFFFNSMSPFCGFQTAEII